MTRLDGGTAVPASLRGAMVALGNFDGFHLGHQAVVGRAVARARAEGRPAIVATFDPHPVRHFRPDAPAFRLTSLDQRERLFAAAGADAMLVFHFDADLAALSAEDFIADRLVGNIGARGVVTGEDFTFGHDKRGTTAMLAALGAGHGMAVETVAPVTLDGEIVSSTHIRAALKAGDPRTAARLLTRPFAIEGVVQHGDKLGRTIGYPTANIDMGKYLRPAYGIYAVHGAAGRRDRAVERCGESGHPAELRSAEGIAGTVFLRFRRATCTAARSRSRWSSSCAPRRRSTIWTRW